MKKEKKTIKEEIEKEFDAKFIEKHWLNIRPSWKFVPEDKLGEVNPANVKKFMFEKISYILQRFIEETKIPLKTRPREEINPVTETTKSGVRGEYLYAEMSGYNQALKEINQKQVKWLKENLSSKEPLWDWDKDKTTDNNG